MELMYICILKQKIMNHIKNYLKEGNNYGVDINFTIDENNNYISGVTCGDETQMELKMICQKLIELGFIPKHNKTTNVCFVDGGDIDDVPIIDLYFSHNNIWDNDNTPVITVTEQFLNDIGF